MRRKWSPSLKQLDLYDELLREQNKVRREILRRRVKLERELKGRRLPDLVVPKHAKIKKLKNYRFKSFKEYQSKVRELKRLYGHGILSFYKSSYKDNVLEVYRNMIKGALESEGIYYNNYEPETLGGYYSKEQIESAGDIGKYMRLYNQLRSMPVEKFVDMYERGYIVPLRYIYQEMISGTKSQSVSFLEEQKEEIRIYNSIYGK